MSRLPQAARGREALRLPPFPPVPPMLVFSLLLALLAGPASARPASAGPAPARAASGPAQLTEPAEPAAAVWRAPAVVAADGALRALPGWRVGLGPGGRAHLLGPAPQTASAVPAPAQWDDEAAAGAVRVAVRVAARDAAAVYVEGRLRRGDRTRTFLLRWDAATGDWSEAASR